MKSANNFGLFFLSAILLFGTSTQAEEAAPEKHKTGQYEFSVTGVDGMLWLRTLEDYGGSTRASLKAKILAGDAKYLTLDQGQGVTYQVATPDSYQAGMPHGLLVYINSSNSGKLPGNYHKLLKQYRLIVIGADGLGNEAATVVRHSAAATAVQFMKDRYDIDSDRIYVIGTSGGGRVTSQVMIMNSDLFTGGFPLLGANACIPMKNSDSKGNTFQDQGVWKKPDPRQLALSKVQNRFVFLTGSKDYNQQNVKLISEGYQGNGFKNVLYLEEPNLGHQNPSPEWFEKGLIFLDQPLVVASAKVYDSAKTYESKGQVREAYEAYRKAALHGRGQTFQKEAEDKVNELKPKAHVAGEEAFASLVAKKSNAEALRKFRDEWTGYSASELAEQALNEMSLAELEPLKGKVGPASRIPFQKFLEKWEGYAAYGEALALMDASAAKEVELAKNEKNEKLRHNKLKSFAKAWWPAASAKAAWAQLTDEADAILEEIKALTNPADKFRKLKDFANTYDGTPPGSMAKNELEKMIKEAEAKK